MPMDEVWEWALRLLITGLLGAMVGTERESRGHPAGIRTQALVALAAPSSPVWERKVSSARRWTRPGWHRKSSRVSASLARGHPQESGDGPRSHDGGHPVVERRPGSGGGCRHGHGGGCGVPVDVRAVHVEALHPPGGGADGQRALRAGPRDDGPAAAVAAGDRRLDQDVHVEDHDGDATRDPFRHVSIRILTGDDLELERVVTEIRDRPEVHSVSVDDD